MGKTQGVAVFQGGAGGHNLLFIKQFFVQDSIPISPSECSQIPFYEYKSYFKAWSEFENDPNQQNMFRWKPRKFSHELLIN